MIIRMMTNLKQLMKLIIVKLFGLNGFLIFKKILLRRSIRQLFYRSRVEKKIYFFLHVARSGGTYLRNVFEFAFGNVVPDSEFEDKHIDKFLKKPTVLLAIQKKHIEYNENIEKNMYRFMFIRDPDERIVSRYFYLKNYNKIKNVKHDNRINKSNMNFTNYLDKILENYHDNLIVRTILNKVNYTFFEQEIIFENIKFKSLNENDYKDSLKILKKYEVILTENIDYFIKKKFKVNFKKIRQRSAQNFKNASLKNNIEFSNLDIEKLNKINFYDKQLYNHVKNMHKQNFNM